MFRRKFSSRKKFSRWIKNAAGIVITAVTISNGLVEIGNTVDALPLFQKVAIYEHTNLPKGSYTVEYELKSEDTEEQDLSYFRTIYVIGYTAVTVENPVEIGTLLALKKAIESEEYVLLSSKKDSVVSIAIKQPSDPIALEKLIEKLKVSRAFFTIDNGSGYVEMSYSGGRQLS